MLGADGNLFMSCVSTLVRESREFGTLLGRREPHTGVRKAGAIDKVSRYQCNKRRINDNILVLW